MKVFLSNDLEILADRLRDRLYFSGLDFFAEKTVVVPHLLVKNFLLHRWAKDPRLGVATGVRIETLSSFLKMTSQMELSLLIENALRNERSGPLADYLQDENPKRLQGLCDELAALFLRYAAFAEEPPGWQKELWEMAKPTIEGKKEGHLFLFHISFLPQPIARLFDKAEGFFLSPSQMFWGDAASIREQRLLSKKVCGIGETFEGQNRLLGNLGKMGRGFLTFLEGEEEYNEPKGNSFLAAVQKEVLYLEEAPKTPDDSVQIHAASSKMNEVKALKETLLRMGCKSNEVLVLAPDIADYAPYIHAVFQGSYDYAIFDLELSEESLLAKGLKLLLKLPALDFAMDAVLDLFSFSNFLEKFRLTQEQAHEMGRWVKKARMLYGLDGLDRLLQALISIPEEKELYLDFTDVPLLAKLVEIFLLLKEKLDLSQDRSVVEWMAFFSSLAETFFAIGSEDELLLRNFRAHPRVQDLIFSYESIERILNSILNKKSGSFQGGVLHAIRFASLSTGSSIPSKTICLLGLEEDLFPRKEKRLSIAPEAKEYQPSKMDEDRYLFLELLLSARENFLLFYTKVDAEDGKEKEASSVLLELSHLGVPIQHHRPPLFFPPHQPKPLFAFDIQKEGKDNWGIDLRTLREFARHPLRYFLQRIQGVEFEREENRFPEFIISPLDLYQLRRQSLQATLDDILAKAESNGMLPQGTYGEAAKEKIGKAVEEYQNNLAELGVGKLEEIAIDVDVPLADGRIVRVFGQLDDVAEEGLVFHGEDKIEDLVKVWPLYMAYLVVNKKGKLLLSKSGKARDDFVPDPLLSLGKYLAYFEKSQPSPFLPAWAKPFLQGTQEALEKAMEDSANGFFPDEVIRYTSFPPAEKLYRTWSPLLREVFSELI